MDSSGQRGVIGLMQLSTRSKRPMTRKVEIVN